jgi:hypothetical protein
MAQLVLIVLTALAAAAGYWETVRFTEEHGGSFTGVTPRRGAIACGVVGLIVAVFMPALVVGALAGVVGYHEARKLAATWREAPFGIPVPGWVVACVAFGFGSATLTSPAVSLVVCGFLALVGALFVSIEECDVLADEKRVLQTENRALFAQRIAKSPIQTAAVSPNPGGAQPGVAGQ